MDSGAEQLEVSQKERNVLRAVAENIQLKDPSQFEDLSINYSRSWRRYQKELRERIASGNNDIVVLVQLGARVATSIQPYNLEPDQLEIYLARRLPDRVYGNTWAPIMGKIEEEDLKHEFVKLSRISFGEFLLLVPVLREEQEEKMISHGVAPAGYLAQPYLDKETGRIIHVAVKFYPVLPEVWERDPAILSEGDREHSKTMWFKFGEMPLGEMAEGSKKAIKNALLEFAEGRRL